MQGAPLLPDACGPSCGSTCFPGYGVGGACGPACAAGCGPAYDCIPPDPTLCGHGHFIGDVGAYFLVPVVNPRTAYTAQNAAGGNTPNDFPRDLDYGARGQIGYIAHNTWGIRADYWYLHGNTNETVANANPAETFVTPMQAPFTLMSPSGTLAQGIGADQFRFAQKLDLNVADVEVLKEWKFMDTTMLFGFGGRYAQFIQGYSATRINSGGVNPANGNAVELDNASATSESRFQGWGPTFSFEIMQPIWCPNLAFYANARASFLWGTERLYEGVETTNRSTIGGVTNFTDTINAASIYDHRVASIGEIEVGLQYGCRVGPCYLFARAGLVVQRWWDVGSPTTSNGSVEFLGGSFKVGLTY